MLTCARGVARNLFRRETKHVGVSGDLGDFRPPDPQTCFGVEATPRVQPRWVSPPEAEDIYTNNNCNNVLTQNPYLFSASEFPWEGEHVPLIPPSVRPWSVLAKESWKSVNL